VPVIAIADIFGISGRRNELADLLIRTERRARTFPGSRRYVFAARLDAPDEFVLLSEWDTYDAMSAYHHSEQFAQYQFDLSGLLARPSDMTIFSVTRSVHPVPSGPPDPRDAD
jgi:quinol monooxygenase YgiN